MFARVLGWVGRVMIASGALLLLFVAYQLWGTQLQTASAQNTRTADFATQKQRVLDHQVPVETTATTAPPTTLAGGQVEDPALAESTGTTFARRSTTSSTTTITRPGDTTPPTTSGPGDENDENLGIEQQFRYSKGQTIGVIKIPKIGSDFAAIEGVDLPLLTEGPGHFPGTAFPGQAGNAAFAGHRVTYKAPFNRIDELVPGDKVEVETVQGKFTYEVMPQANGLGYYIISPTDTSILEDRQDNRLTLMACHPKYDLAQRIVVTAKLVGNVAPPSVKGAYDKPTLPAADGGPDTTGTGTVDTLGSGNPNARFPALAFSLAALGVWMAAYLLGRKWKRWPAYLIAAPLFFLLLWFAFDYINQALPAAY